MLAQPATRLKPRFLLRRAIPRSLALCLLICWSANTLHPQESIPGSIPVSFTVQLAEGKRFVSTGGILTLSLTTNADASPSSVSYQWRRDGQPIPGATTRTLTLDNLQPSDAGSYDVVVIGIVFPYVGSVTSNAAAVIVGQLSQIVRQPPNIDTVVGSTAVLRVEATGDGPLTYQWANYSWFGPTGGGNIVDDATHRGSQTDTLVINPTSFLDRYAYFVCGVTDVYGHVTGTRVIRLTVSNPLSFVVTTLPTPPDYNGHFGAIAADATGSLVLTNSSSIQKMTPEGLITTLAGQSSGGSADGTGNSAQFSSIAGITIDSAGNIYVTDNHTIRKVTADGVVTTLAGLAGSTGTADGLGSAARFNWPTGITTDPAGNIYVTDTNNQTIRKISPDGAVTTLAGSAGDFGYAEGSGNTARFSYPRGIAADAAGNLYVADTNNDVIRKVTPSGAVSTVTVAANSSEIAVHISSPYNIAVDAAGILYVPDQGHIYRIVPGKEVTVMAGTIPISRLYTSADGTGATATFAQIIGIALDQAGTLYVVDSGFPLSQRIRKCVPTTLAARLSSLSARGLAGTGDQTLIAGFATSGDDTKQLLLRGIGPGLTPFGVSGVLADPALTLFNAAGTVLQQNNDWGGSATLTAIFAQLGSFSLPANSKDAALLATLPPGVYTAHLTAQGGTGVALLEATDADPGTPTARLASLSARDQVGTGDNILIAGFIITGSISRTVLIRGIGPTLARYGVSGVLANPQLQVFQGNTLLAQNDDWGGAATLAAVATQVKAFALDANSKDAALLLTLPPGNYTAQVSGVSNTTGVALVEIYEVL